jgi:hypothetical protein
MRKSQSDSRKRLNEVKMSAYGVRFVWWKSRSKSDRQGGVGGKTVLGKDDAMQKEQVRRTI